MRKKLLSLCLTVLISAVSTAAWALSEVGGVYQIGTAEDLEAFAALVNEGEAFANAVLTADIVKDVNGVMIGDGTEYEGIFDGQGHTVTINIFQDAVNGTGLFKYIGRKGMVRNLKVQGDITTSTSFAGGLTGYLRGMVRGCYIDVTIHSNKVGDATDGGVVGIAYTGSVIENCLVKIVIDGTQTQNCGGVVGWADNKTNIANCLVITDGSTLDTSNGGSSNIGRNGGYLRVVDVGAYNADNYSGRPNGACYNNYVTQNWGTNNATTVVPLDELADGRICYQLNHDQSTINWVQQIGTDPFPVPAAFGTGQVYASAATDCDGKTDAEVTYSNSGSSQATAHTTDAMGVCTTCGYFNFHAFDTSYDQAATDRSVPLSTKQDIDRCEVWNSILGGFKLNMKMVNDIEYVANPGEYIFDVDNWVDGDFNGDGHQLTIEMSDMGTKASFIPVHTGVFENVIMHGTIKTNGTNAGSISGNGRQSLVRNVFSDINIESSINGDNSSGGFFGIMYGEKTVENCIYAGDFITPRNPETGSGYVRIGGFSGWAGGQTYFNNCAFLGNLVGAGGVVPSGTYENSQNISRNPGSVICENVYVANPIYGSDVSDHEKFTVYDNHEGIASGELAFFLNGKLGGVDRFYQLIGTDPKPLPIKKEGALVYAVGAAGYSTFYDAGNDWELKGDAQAYIGTTINGSALHLAEIEDIPKNTAVVISGTYYNKVSTTATSNTEDNVLLGSDGTKMGGDGIYALAKKNDKVGFYPVSSDVTIPAGKAYLDLGETGVKGFTFTFDDDATAISEFSEHSDYSDTIYNLAGQRLGKIQKGIYIINGKKVLF